MECVPRMEEVVGKFSRDFDEDAREIAAPGKETVNNVDEALDKANEVTSREMLEAQFDGS